MKKIVHCSAISPLGWCLLFTRDELRAIARKTGVPRGRNKRDTAQNIHDQPALMAIVEIHGINVDTIKPQS